jgi:hypothetical protein
VKFVPSPRRKSLTCAGFWQINLDATMAVATYAEVSWAGWLEKVPATLRPRLQELLDNPEG